MNILAFDPGFANLGYCVMELGELGPYVRSFGHFETKLSAKNKQKKREVLSTADNSRRGAELATFMMALVTKETIVIAAEAFSPARNASAAAKMARCWGILDAMAALHGMSILEASPQQVKVGATGNASASKEEVEAGMIARYPELRTMGAGIAKTNREHPFDAVAVAHVMLRRPEVTMVIRMKETQA